MSEPKLFDFIKTSCGRTKYLELAAKKGLISKIRLWWFIFFAVIKDSRLEKPDHNELSNS
tara:strand:- start:1970 stop:2149 length:180 start_codon:yes stop_codon:yes gene_type:complete